MKDYSAMSDFEINKLVGGLSGEAASTEPVLNLVMRTNGRKFDPCNNPADAWPIIVANKISINHWHTGNWTADSFGGDFVFSDTPLRAAMIAYLQMMEGKS